VLDANARDRHLTIRRPYGITVMLPDRVKAAIWCAKSYAGSLGLKRMPKQRAKASL
jgi:hypothetical protein